LFSLFFVENKGFFNILFQNIKTGMDIAKYKIEPK